MSRRYSNTYFLSTAFKSFTRNGFMNISTIIILVSAMLICGTFSLVFVNLDHNVAQIDDYNEIVVYAKDGTTDEDLEAMRTKIEEHKNTKSVTFVPKEEGIVNVRELFGPEYDYLFQRYDEGGINPLPDSFIIEFHNINQFDELKYFLSFELDNVDQVSSHLDIAKKVHQIKNIILIVSLVLTGLLAIVSLFIIANTIKLTFKYREEEIAIMKFIGATNFFITWPFILESWIVAIISAGLAFGIEFFAYGYICKVMAEHYPMIQTIPVDDVWTVLAAAFFGASILVCFVGAFISTRRYSKV